MEDIYSISLKKEMCNAALELIGSCSDFGETGEISIEGNSIGVEVYPIGLAMAPEKLENELVELHLVERCAYSSCIAAYTIVPKSADG